jgi:uncharacterized protein with PQ loop repeat
VQQAIGWAASAVLVGMLATQIGRQWRQGTSQGVSRWLFVGQLVASSLFTVYSVLVRDPVFIVTNGAMAVGAALGLALVVWHRRQGR